MPLSDRLRMGILSDDGCDGESDYDKKVRAKGEQLLTEVNESFIFTSSGHTIREIPTFRPEEISLGRVLVCICYDLRLFDEEMFPNDAY